MVFALRRFTARRGQAKLFVSDNFVTFKSSVMKDYLRKNDITWHFILERSPWWGGFYERLIGLTKSTLKKVLNKSVLNFEQLMTMLLEVESVLNSRPLTYIDDNPNTQTLTPNHLIFGRQLNEKCFENTGEITKPIDICNSFKSCL